MKIIEALHNDDICDFRITCGRRWLVGNFGGGFTVYERKDYAKKTTICIETENEDLAVHALVNDKELT